MIRGKTIQEQSIRFTNGEVGAIFAPRDLNETDFRILRKTIDLLEDIVNYDKSETVRKLIEEDVLYIED